MKTTDASQQNGNNIARANTAQIYYSVTNINLTHGRRVNCKLEVTTFCNIARDIETYVKCRGIYGHTPNGDKISM